MPNLSGGVTDCLRPLKLIWLTERLLWVDQWPVPHEKAEALRELVEEQLQLNHVVPTTHPWNTPVLVIKKNQANGTCYMICEQSMPLYKTWEQFSQVCRLPQWYPRIGISLL